jgi:DNA primase
LNALVNKHIRERIGKLEARGKSSVGPGGWKAPGGGAGAPTGAGGPGSAGGGNGAGGMSGAGGAGVAGPSPADGQWGSRTSIPEGESPLTPEEKDAFDLLNQEEANERALMRVLLEHGGKSFDDEGLVADYIFRQFEDADLFDNKTIYHLFDLYREHFRKGSVPDTRTFLYHQDTSVSALVVGLTETRHELSDRWHKRDADLDYDTIKKGYLKYLGKSYVVKEEKADQERYKEEVRSTVTYMQLKKIKKLIQENQKDMERPHTPEELALLKDTHRHLKDLEIELTSRLGTVILK